MELLSTLNPRVIEKILEKRSRRLRRSLENPLGYDKVVAPQAAF